MVGSNIVTLTPTKKVKGIPVSRSDLLLHQTFLKPYKLTERVQIIFSLGHLQRNSTNSSSQVYQSTKKHCCATFINFYLLSCITVKFFGKPNRQPCFSDKISLVNFFQHGIVLQAHSKVSKINFEKGSPYIVFHLLHYNTYTGKSRLRTFLHYIWFYQCYLLNYTVTFVEIGFYVLFCSNFTELSCSEKRFILYPFRFSFLRITFTTDT